MVSRETNGVCSALQGKREGKHGEQACRSKVCISLQSQGVPHLNASRGNHVLLQPLCHSSSRAERSAAWLHLQNPGQNTAPQVLKSSSRAMGTPKPPHPRIEVVGGDTVSPATKPHGQGAADGSLGTHHCPLSWQSSTQMPSFGLIAPGLRWEESLTSPSTTVDLHLSGTGHRARLWVSPGNPQRGC